MSFEDKVVIVTGASSGIGECLALSFAEEGAKVVLVSNDEKKLRNVAKKCGIIGSKLTVVADISKEDEIRRVLHEAVQFFGQIDILINNAGIATPASILGGNAMEVFDQVMATNLRAGVYLTHLAAEHLIETKGNIVNITSVAAKTVFDRESFAYSTAKAGLDFFTRAIAAELSPKGVRVNAIVPGPVKTNLLESMGLSGEKVDAAWENYRNNTALKRLSEPREVVDLALFLASKKAVAITGSSFVIDNGLLVNTQF